MPGILPMKVIKVGSSAQSRIAQACDRCRSKKIRCDGVRPSCTQCVNVGFECKTSDKLSRRAFPRGYTESLEERVRALEAEVRELKDLLDEKDEKIDMLSRIHSHSPQSMQTSPRPSVAATGSESPAEADKDNVFKVTQSPILFDNEGSDGYFVGTSSGRALVDAFKNKVQETGKSLVEIRADAFFKAESKQTGSAPNKATIWRAPPRLLSDQLINIFFQEWAPIFPVLHRPTFLHLYEDYTAAPESVTDKKSLAQLHLVFGIAALSNQTHNVEELASIERQWRAALDSFLMTDSLVTLQCLTLAIIYCLQSADHSGLLKFKCLAVSLSQRLGLHQSQKRFALGTLTSETRKKVFWTLYTLDCFSAAQIGLPKLMREDDVHCEYPVDADDEYVTEKGFLPTLPGESTKLSSALALFRATPVLAKVLKELYPASPTHDISFKTLTSLADELDAWLDNLPAHLKLQFVQDKPSTHVVNSRSPLLSLAYHYIRSLIHRPAVCASSLLGDRASSSIVAIASSAKCIIQIIQLLEERSLGFSFCLNKNELLIVSGFSLLFQSLDLDRDGKLMRDHQRTLKAIVEILEQRKAPGARHFRKVAGSILSALSQAPILSRQNSDKTGMTTQDALRSTQKHLKAIAARLSPDKQRRRESDNISLNDDGRRATAPAIGSHPNNSQNSLSSIHSEPATLLAASHRPSPTTSNPAVSPSFQQLRQSPPNQPLKRSSTSAAPRPPNLDYLSFTASSPAGTISPRSSTKATPADILRAYHATADWEKLISSLDQTDSNIYDSIYGGPGGAQNLVWDAQSSASTNPTSNGSMDAPNFGWRPGFAGLTPLALDGYPMMSPAPVPQSVLSFSDESLSSGEEFSSVGMSTGGRSGSAGLGDEVDVYADLDIGMLKIPADDMGGLDGGFGL
ncbi:hypothetical protein NA57DRAFT_31927 [Rhizodiscina lignyota]|uniref:Zn(2)-C6 fungal-type domain-containing protein n=1 Tax=Rhizodiscina lignyota TaxID=1504668 RepID=A0A9P4IJB3_9PEZI|nr:hypothetical protein NA57DRAFT_31927 [Rhizodiscina lignyota]